MTIDSRTLRMFGGAVNYLGANASKGSAGTCGSVDHVAVISARLQGWKTRTFTEKVCFHHRQMGTAQAGGLKARFKFGVKDYCVGNHPLWEAFRTVYQMTNRPFVIGGLALGSGYAWSLVRHKEIPLPSDLVAFVRREQMQRLKKFLERKAGLETRQAPVVHRAVVLAGSRSSSESEDKCK
jgi:hypothetical protein